MAVTINITFDLPGAAQVTRMYTGLVRCIPLLPGETLGDAAGRAVYLNRVAKALIREKAQQGERALAAEAVTPIDQ